VQTLAAAIDLLHAEGYEILTASRFFSSPAFPAGSGPDYVNAAVLLQTDKTPQSVLEDLHRIEARLGRQRTARWAARTVDLDLVAFGQQIAPDPQTLNRWMTLPADLQRSETPDRLILPHPRLHERAFVLVPMAEVAPDWQHPALGLTVRQMLDRLPEAEKAAIRPVT
jgi:2-amino-4-hydroxy-6-hydroxymethyldihydropteridine diphosphokinase